LVRPLGLYLVGFSTVRRMLGLPSAAFVVGSCLLHDLGMLVREKAISPPESERDQPRIVISTASGLTPKVAARAFLASSIVNIATGEFDGRDPVWGGTSLVGGMG